MNTTTDRVQIIEGRGHVTVTVENVKAAHILEYIVRYNTETGREDRVQIMSHQAAVAHAESIAAGLRRGFGV